MVGRNKEIGEYMKFVKMQGAGNDYVYVDCFKEKVENPSEVAIKVSDRHFGVGSDGLILICPSDIADVKMDMYNADGSRGLMCGNGSRCVAKYAYDHGYVNSEEFTMETGAGIKHIKIEPKNKKAEYINVNMGRAKITSQFPEKILINGEEKEFIGVDVGNPHAVYYVDTLEELQNMDLNKVGEYYEKHERFPQKVNSEFIYVEDRKNIHMRVWERGSGETLACGTGACASAFATMKKGDCDTSVRVHLLGGELDISLVDDEIYMRGRAEYVFTGEINF